MEVTYIDHMGDDLRVVNAARVSFAKESEWEFKCETCGDNQDDCWRNDDVCGCDGKPTLGKKVLSEPDQKLIKYLAKHNHWTPFSHVQITMREKVPIFVARQVFRSTVGISRNEVSRRYVDDQPETWIPEEGGFRSRPEGSIKQGSGGVHPKSEEWRRRCAAKNELDKRFYEDMIADGIAPEQARAFLPQSMYTEFYTTASLSAWVRMYNLRSDPHAQGEIIDLAKMWDRVISGISELEYSWQALKN